MNTIEVLEKFQPVLHTASWVSDGLRWIGWQIIKMMANAADGLTSMYSQAFKLIDFWNSKDVTGFVATYQPVFLGFRNIRNCLGWINDDSSSQKRLTTKV